MAYALVVLSWAVWLERKKGLYQAAVTLLLKRLFPNPYSSQELKGRNP